MAARCQTFSRHYNSTARSGQGSESTGTSTVNTGHTGQNGQGTARGESCSLIAPGKKKQRKPSNQALISLRHFSIITSTNWSPFVTSTMKQLKSSIAHFYPFSNKSWIYIFQILNDGTIECGLDTPQGPNPWCWQNVQGRSDVGKVVYLSAVNPCLRSTIRLFR